MANKKVNNLEKRSVNVFLYENLWIKKFKLFFSPQKILQISYFYVSLHHNRNLTASQQSKMVKIQTIWK